MSEKPLVKTASKDVLARCMATEDITVQHSASAQTAYFDTQNRVLCLPIWKDMDNSMYDMLVGHEVSHALNTPAEGWQDFVGDGKGAKMRHMFLNVVEDARIERMIKDKFPGLRRDFASAYATLQERDIFEISGKDLSTLALIDRLNLKFKVGLHCQHPVPFASAEQQYVTRMAETTTFEDVMELARELYELQAEEDEKKQQEEQAQQGASPESGDGEGDEGTGSTPSDSDESGESDESGAGSSAGDEDGDEESSDGSSAGDGDGDESGEDSGASMNDDTDDGESAESTTGDGDESGEGEGDQQSDLDYDDYNNNQECAGGTQNAFEKGVEDLRDNEVQGYSYHTLPAPVLENIVVGPSKIAELWNNVKNHRFYNDASHVETRTKQMTALREYQNSIKGTVAQMVQQFQMKQAAEADKRTEIAKTGVLDTNTMINYRWSEDIFVKNEVHADGKNHGMVMYVDWSGSMSGILQDTVEQLLVLVEFCRKVNIPYEVYAFSSNEYCPFEDFYSDEAEAWRKEKADTRWTPDRDTDCTPHEFALYNFLSSKLNKRDYAEALDNLWMLTYSQSRYGHCHSPRCLSLGCTPLNEAIVCAMDMVPAFQQANGIEIVNTVFLTDGDGHGMISRSYRGWGNSKAFVTDKKTKKNYDITRGETNGLLNMLRDRTGTNLIGIRLHDANNVRFLRYNMEEAEYRATEKQYKTQNFITLKSAYDEYFLVKGDLKVETDAMDNLENDASLTKIRNAFLKGGNRRKASRVIANKMVDIFAA